MEMDISLSGKTALVGGASQGIGEATVRAFAQAGARVILMARSEDRLQKIASNLPGKDHRVLAVDVGDRGLLKQKVSSLVQELGAIHILVCNSGGPKGGPIVDATEEQFLSGFQNHVLVNSLLTQLLLPGMKKSSYGRILNIISTSVKIPIAGLGVSNTIRAAVANWAKTLSLEVAPFGVTVNNVLPGYTQTPRLAALLAAAAERQDKTLEEVSREWMKSIPLGRFAEASEVANALAFLASPAAAYITGVNLPVDGGRTGSL
jgi:3-oxoacyl-[acyl-carrier protein] reductase